MKNNSIVTVLGQRSPSARAVAYFRSSSQVDHEYAISSQQDQVRQWAKERGIEIIHEFCDIGPSGLDTRDLPAFTEMLNDWIKQRPDFEYILCFDATRWGRFHGSDLLVQASDIFQTHKKEVVYTSVDSV
jgi:DNA invertase Pin-like site-specific DNA recombinase